MGTTIRREPVTTSIPAAPDYRFLNITNFGGIEKSSNPFVVESNTASDCLNVYVDEDNALSTRPRLQHQTDFIKDVVDKFPTIENSLKKMKLFGVYSLSDGFLIHFAYEDPSYYGAYLFKYVNKNEIKSIDNADKLDNAVLTVFEQNDSIFVLDGKQYYEIKDNALVEIEGKIPLVTVGKHKRILHEEDGTVEYDVNGSSFESVNLLSDKYKESYFWDGISEFKLPSNTESFENSYYQEKTPWSFLDVLVYYPDGSFLYKKETGNTIKLMYGVLNDDASTYEEYETGIDVSSISINGTEYPVSFGFPQNSHNKTFAIVKPKTNDSQNIEQNGDLILYTINGSGNTTTIATYSNINTINAHTTPDGISISLSENGEFVWLTADGYLAKKTNDYGTSVLEYSETTSIQGYYKNTLSISDVTRNAYLLVTDAADTFCRIYFTNDIGSVEFKATETALGGSEISNRLSTVQFLPKSLGFLMSFGRGLDVFYKQNNYMVSTHFSLPGTEARSVYFSPDAKYAILVGYNNNVYFASDFENINDYYKLPIMVPYGSIVRYFKPSDALVTTNWSWNIQKYTESNEPLILVTRKIDKNDSFYKDWSDLRTRFLKSSLVSRFDNNTWFASDNYTFYTQYNDPRYVPMNSHNDLGESFEPITGLSIVNDNVLAAYKRNKIYIITPITVGNVLTYSYTETKNVIGNDVVNAPTLTILTEMPILVSYDGIYALNQLENVQSSDRITTLISEAMNPKWLKERKEDVDKCIVLNRLYWTYFILPHKKTTTGVVKDNDYTKIYLLDNRTGMWFYWELPIYVISAIIKNNKTHFVTNYGELYSLETTDIINKFNKDLTEYYDDLKKPSLIPWHWTSQILSLNTINYSKRLVDTTFVLTDTDMSDMYALNYKFKAFRKNKNAETTELTLTNDIEYVESITKRTMIPRFNFLQFTLSNTEDDQKLNNNKLRLVGLGLKYVLLGGLY